MFSTIKNIQTRNLIAIMGILSGYAFLWFTAQYNSDYSFTLCPFKLITGYPCPGCGMGRSSVELYLGHFHDSIHFHWLGIPFNIGLIIALVWLVRDLFKNSDSFWKFIDKPMNSRLMTIVIIAIIINWIRALYLEL